MSENKETRAFTWLLGDKTGISSKALLAASYGVWVDADSHPSDGADFNRCVNLIKDVPEAKTGFRVLSEKCEYWRALILRWDEVEKVLSDELLTPNGDGRTYALMRSIYLSVDTGEE